MHGAALQEADCGSRHGAAPWSIPVRTHRKVTIGGTIPTPDPAHGRSMSNQSTISVIGAGMVGTCCALYLQNEGFEVTLLDRGGPGEGASSGNLGGFGVASCPPAAMPGVLRKVPGMLLDAHAPLRIRRKHALRALPWFLRFAANARRGRVEALPELSRVPKSPARRARTPRGNARIGYEARRTRQSSGEGTTGVRSRWCW